MLVLFAASRCAAASATGVMGQWNDPTGSTILIEPCGADVCATLIGISQGAPTQVDRQNPDPSLRTRPLCGLRIGSQFRLTDANHATGGTLYDPVSGKTYKGSMSSDGNALKLRGYIGISMFGRSQTWTRSTSAVAPCRS